MADKIKNIELQAGTQRESFPVDHAERILNMPNNGGWKLPKGSKFEYSKANGLRVKRNNGSVKDAD